MKKSEFISFRTDPATKEYLTQVASEKKWSISQLVEEIIQQWIQEETDKTES